ncbi:MAG TPA: hypothetical protein VEL07_03470 [Planctomycetota bacterium]|nr:hypothetical protein [Planctomycetota bacterium]
MPDAEASRDPIALPAAEPQVDADPPAGNAPMRGGFDELLRAIVDRRNARERAATIPDVAASVVVGAVAGARSGLTDLARNVAGLGGLAGSDLATELALRAEAHAGELDRSFADRHGDRPLGAAIRDLGDAAVQQAPIIAAGHAGGTRAAIATEAALLAGDAYVDLRVAGAEHDAARGEVMARGIDRIRAALHGPMDEVPRSGDP